MRKAVIDIGTNSVKLIIGERSAEGEAKTLCDVSVITKLGEGLKESGKLGEAAMARTAAAIIKLAQFAKAQGACETECVGTMALRTASNSQEFIALVKSQDGPEIRIISGEEEAELSSAAILGSIEGAKSGKTLIFDTGGGSTEFVAAENGITKKTFSVPVGAVTLTDANFKEKPADPKKVCKVIAELTETFTGAGVEKDSGNVIGAGGNVTAIATVAAGLAEYDPVKIHGSVLTRTEVMRQTAIYTRCTDAELRSIPGLPPKRAEVILGGACIILAAMEAAGAEKITVSDRSLRHELLARSLEG